MHAAVLTAFLFALTGICAAQSSRLLGASRANAWRLLVALVLLAFWAHVFGQGWGGGVMVWFLVAGALGFGVGGWLMFQALRRVGSTLSLLVVECSATVFASAIGWIWLGAALTLLEMGLIFLILSGVILGMSPGPIIHLDRVTVRRGVALAAGAALFQAISFNLSRLAFTHVEATGESLGNLTAAYQRLLGGAAVASLIWLVVWWRGRRSTADKTIWTSPFKAPVWVLGNALFGPVLGVSCMLWAIRLVPNPGLVQAVAATATLLTVPLAYALEGARPKPSYYAGFILALTGVAGLLIT